MTPKTPKTSASVRVSKSTRGSKSPPSPPSPSSEKPRLTEKQKKENHIRSEQKRREAIREGFDRLASMIPGLEGLGRSEAIVLEGTVNAIRAEVMKREAIIEAAQKKGIDTTGWELPKEITDVVKAQITRVKAEEEKARLLRQQEDQGGE